MTEDTEILQIPVLAQVKHFLDFPWKSTEIPHVDSEITFRRLPGDYIMLGTATWVSQSQKLLFTAVCSFISCPIWVKAYKREEKVREETDSI